MLLSGLLTGCKTDDGLSAKSGSWSIDKQADRITGAPLSGAIVYTLTSNNSMSDVSNRRASLQLICFENRPIVRLAFDYKVGTDRNTSFGYRFVDKPGRDNVESRILLGYQVMVIEDNAALAQFLDDLRGSAMLYVRLRSLNAGRTTAEFKVDGAEAAIEASYEGCPLQPAPKRRTT